MAATAVSMKSWDEMMILFLAKRGLCASTISRVYHQFTGRDYTVRQIYRICWKADIHFGEYRRGEGKEVEQVLQQAKMLLGQGARRHRYA